MYIRKADRVISANEKRIINELLDITEEETDIFKSLTDADSFRFLNTFIDFLDMEGRCALFDLIACILASDNFVSVDEKTFVAQVLKRIFKSFE